MFYKLLKNQQSKLISSLLWQRKLSKTITTRRLSSSKFNLFGKNKNKTTDNDDQNNNKSTFLIFPEIPNDTEETNEFLLLPTTGLIPFDKLSVEKCVIASGKISLELEHFIDDYSNTLKQEFDDKDISNSKLLEFITEMEKHLMPLQYNLNLLSAFKVINPKEFDFTTFDEFFIRRLAKSRLRFSNRSIYCFMCEMKARDEFFGKIQQQMQQQQQDLIKKSNKDKDNVDANYNDLKLRLEDELKFKLEQKRQLIERYLREAKLNGLSLKNQNQLNVYYLINEKLLQEQRNFIVSALNANQLFQSQIISPQFLDCLPDYVITQLNHHDLDSVFNSFMRYCPDQTLRKDFWLSYNARAAPYLGSTTNNFLVVEKIREARLKKAQILGYENFAQMSLDLRGSGCKTMAGTVENVTAFINGLGQRTEKKFLKNFNEIQSFAMEFRPEGKRVKKSPITFMPANTVIEKFQMWDWKYFERLFLREQYQLNSADIRAYFPLDRVIQGMLNFSEKLFQIKIIEIKDDDNNNNKNVWNRNVRQFKIFDNNKRSNAEYGTFYLDAFQPISRIFLPIARSDQLNTKPIVFFLMNFSTETKSVFDQFEKQQLLQATGKELLNFQQVIQLFNKFGFVLQHLLTQIDFSEVGGLANIEADAFNMCSHFMSLWPLNSYEVIKECSSHFKTGESMSEEFFERIRQSYYHFNSFPLKYELYLMALDLNLHTTREHSSTLLKKTWQEWMQPFETIDENGHICSWLDLFKGNGQEGIYYSNKWSEVIAADIFDGFRERGLLKPNDPQCQQMGERFKQTFLAQSGAIETNELFRRFLGRDPTLNGYLTINGFE